MNQIQRRFCYIFSFFFSYLMSFPAGAQKLIESLQPKDSAAVIENAGGLYLTDKGEIVISSTHNGVVLKQQGKGFQSISLLPSVFTDEELSGIAQMPDGRWVIANKGSSKIAITDSSLVERDHLFSQSGDEAGEIDEPRQVSVSVNNRIYVADADNRRISVFNDQGLFLQHFGYHERGSTDLFTPVHIALDAEENVYVLEFGEYSRVSIFTPTGKILHQFPAYDLEAQLGYTPVFSAMTADLNGRLYLGLEDANQILIYDWKNKKLVKQFGSLGQSRGQYRHIALMAVNSNGQLAVLDPVNAKVELYQLDEKAFPGKLKSPRWVVGTKQANNCFSVHAFIDSQTLCIKPQGQGIVILNKDGKETGAFSSEVKEASTIHSGPDRVVILEGNQLHSYQHNGEKIFTVGRYGTAPGGFDNPAHVFSGKNAILVSDQGNNRIQIFGHDGQYINQIYGSEENQLFSVGPAAIDSTGQIYVADQDGAHLIHVFSADLKPLYKIGYDKPSVHRPVKIHALDIDDQDRVYALVTSEANDFSVRVYQDQDLLAEFGSGHKNGTEYYFDTANSMSVASGSKNSVIVNDVEIQQATRFDLLEFPDPAFSLLVQGDKQKTELSWKSSGSPIIDRYQIEVSKQQKGPYQKLQQTKDTRLTLNSHDNGDWYRVVSISGHGLEAKPSNPRENKFSVLQKLSQQGKDAEVIKLAQNILKKSPENADAIWLKAEAEMNSGLNTAAIKSYQQLQQFESYRSPALKRQVKAYFELEQYLDAKALIEEVLSQKPTESEPYIICTELSMQLDDAIGAVTCAEDGLALHPEDIRLRYLLAKGYILAGIEDQGLAEYQTLVEKHPDNSEIRLSIADDLMNMNRQEQALEHYQSILSQNPQLHDAVRGKAQALLHLGKIEEAKNIAIKLSTQKQNRADGFYLLGRIALQQDKATEAVLRLTRAAKESPDNIDAWLSLSDAYVALGKEDKASHQLVQGVNANPESFPLQLKAGQLHLQSEQYLEANRYLENAVRLNSRSLDANYSFAKGLFSSRNYPRAEKYAEKASKMDPKSIDIMTLRARIASQQGKTTQAIELLKTAINQDPASAELQWQLGNVYRDANLFDASQQHLEKSAAINPSWDQPQVSLGLLYSKRRQFDQAIAALEEAIKLNPSEQNRALLNTAFADKKKSLEFKNNAPQLLLSDMNIEPVFSAAYKQYADTALGRVSIKNVSSTEYGNMQLSFHIKEYMDFPMTQEVSLIKGNETQQYDFKVTFNNKILEVDEDIGVQAEIRLNYLRDGKKDSINLTQPMTIYGKNAMIWGQAHMVGSFVTPKDDTLRNYVRSVINSYQPDHGPLNDKLISAMTYFTSLTAHGTRYVIDPQYALHQFKG